MGSLYVNNFSIVVDGKSLYDIEVATSEQQHTIPTVKTTQCSTTVLQIHLWGGRGRERERGGEESLYHGITNLPVFPNTLSSGSNIL